ncbi:MAG: DUF2062 domain-containing protein [Candidatus Lambdaproteobacteria bacterium]|nr:DUF2062 domain-containing protein [Candidatus Lambdaproteobacteria bacterium]
MFEKIRRLVYVHVIKPFQETTAPVSSVAWGATVGAFCALPPTVGIQMYVAASIWVVARYVFRFHFNLPIAIAVVWLTNPVTIVPIYYFYLKTGDWLLAVLGYASEELDYSTFKEILKGLEEEDPVGFFQGLWRGVVAVFWLFGWPIVVGGLFWTVPGTILTYPLTTWLLVKYRKRQAAQEGLTYQQWTAKYVHRE